MTSSRSNRTIWPLTSSRLRVSYSPKRADCSASRIFWMMTCLAVWAAIRPSSGLESSFPLRKARMLPEVRSIWTVTSSSSEYRLWTAAARADSMASKRTSGAMSFSRWIMSTSRRSSGLPAMSAVLFDGRPARPMLRPRAAPLLRVKKKKWVTPLSGLARTHAANLLKRLYISARPVSVKICRPAAGGRPGGG